MKKCPYCAEDIQNEAKKCRFCGEWLENKSNETQDSSKKIEKHQALPTESQNLKIARNNQRISNLIIDGFIIYFVYLVIISALSLGRGWMIYAISFAGYYLFFEAIWKRSPGKIITRTKVTSEDGTVPSFSKILIRTFIRLIPLEAFTFLGSKNPIGWHDHGSKTVTISLDPRTKVVKKYK